MADAQNEQNINKQVRQAEQELKFEEFHHSSLVGYLEFEPGFIIRRVNHTASKLLNQKNEDLTGKSFNDYVAPHYNKAFNSYLHKILNTRERQDQVLELQRKDRKALYIILESIPILDDQKNVISIRSIIIDITEQKQADLKRQSELIQAAVEDMLDPFAILSAERDDSDKIMDFTYSYVNKAATVANKLSKEEIIGRRLLEISPSIKDSEIFKDFINVVETGKPVMKEGIYMEFMLEHQTINGIFHTRINKLDDGIIITFRDITEIKEHEEKLDAALKELEHSNKELEQFAYIASHDLQEPLRMITQFSKLLSAKYTGKLDPRADEYTAYILEGTGRMLELLKDLLKYARITTKAKPFEATDFNQVVQDVLTDLKVLVEDKNVEVSVGDLPRLMADPVQMRQLFQNFIENAVKFHNDERSVIKISAQPEPNEWIFSVEDNGIGIEEKYYERIFMIFQRLHEREKYPGSGIGLSICKKIVERHRGRIWVESEAGKGSIFYFSLPAEQGANLTYSIP